MSMGEDEAADAAVTGADSPAAFFGADLVLLCEELSFVCDQNDDAAEEENDDVLSLGCKSRVLFLFPLSMLLVLLQLLLDWP